MISRFFKDSAIYALAQMCSKGIMILLLPFYTKLLTKAEVGWLDLLLAFYMLIGILLGLELTNAQARFAGEAENVAERSQAASTVLWFTVVSFGLALIPGMLFADQLGALVLDVSGYGGLMRWALLAAASMAVMTIVTNQLRWSLLSLHFGVAGLINTGLFAVFTIVFVWGLGWGVVGVPVATIIGCAGSVIYSLSRLRGAFKVSFDWGLCKGMLAFSLPLVPSSLGAVAMLYVNRVAVQQMLSNDDLGIFSVAMRVAMLAGFVMLGFGNSLTPLIYANYKKPETPHRIADIFRYFTALSLIGLAGLWLGAREVILLLSKPDYLAATGPLCVLSLAVVLQQSYAFAPGAWIAKRTGLLSVINLVGGGLNVVLCLWLIPRFGIMGAAWANLLTAMVIALANFAVSQKCYAIPFAWTKIILTIGAVILLAGLGNHWQGEPGVRDLLWKAPILVLILAVVALGLIDRGELSGISRKLPFLRRAS